MKTTVLFLSVALAAPCAVFAQQPTGVDQAPNSLAPARSRKVHAPRRETVATFRKAKVKHSARYEFYDRVEKAAREKKRILRQLAKPQFSDPAYFGHKRKPKKRPAFLMRYCDECGIRH